MSGPREPLRVRGVFFEMDGLLVDSEAQWCAAESRTVEQLGGTWSRTQQVDLLGSNLEFAADYMIRHTGSNLSTEAVMQVLLDDSTDELSRGIQFRPGAVSLLDALERIELDAA